MKLKFWSAQLQLAHPWKIAGSPGADSREVVFVELTDSDGVTGRGEAVPSVRLGESIAGTLRFLATVDADRLAFGDVPGSLAALAALAADSPPRPGVWGALNQALLDGAAQRAGQPLHDYLGLGFREHHHVTSFSIGLDTPENIRRKTLAAAAYPILKLKVGDPHDRDNLAALRAAAPDKPVRADANEAWRTRDEALRQIEWLAADGNIQFVEQPMPRQTPAVDLAWLRERSPLPLFADESGHTVADVSPCAEFFHGVNFKLAKTGGLSPAIEALRAARRAGLKTMLGCTIESSLLISAAAHLAELADCLDLDGNLLITNDPFRGVTAEQGMLSFAAAPARTGLRVGPRGAGN